MLQKNTLDFSVFSRTCFSPPPPSKLALFNWMAVLPPYCLLILKHVIHTSANNAFSMSLVHMNCECIGKKEQMAIQGWSLDWANTFGFTYILPYMNILVVKRWGRAEIMLQPLLVIIVIPIVLKNIW